jgi:hypothetical protein
LFLKRSSPRHATAAGFLPEVSEIAVMVNKISASKPAEVFLNDTIHDGQQRND